MSPARSAKDAKPTAPPVSQQRHPGRKSLEKTPDPPLEVPVEVPMDAELLLQSLEQEVAASRFADALEPQSPPPSKSGAKNSRMRKSGPRTSSPPHPIQDDPLSTTTPVTPEASNQADETLSESRGLGVSEKRLLGRLWAEHLKESESDDSPT